ncbi:MAG TPA: CIA30 family protein, partial [Gemmatimonadales bacterium]|nr:CIA30 family protein [Gemmatimonadales bacterium]
LADLSDPAHRPWRLFTDAVMGGVSDATATLEEVHGRMALRVRGRVRLENRGGFIQVALALGDGGQPLDASAFRGLRVTVAGTAPGAFLHLRTTDTVPPWAHYAAPLTLGPAWAEAEVPVGRFVPSGTGARLDRAGLLRLGVVAGKAAGDVDVAVARVELY